MTTTQVFLYDLTKEKDLAEVERIKSSPQKYKILYEDTVTVPYRRLEYKILGLAGQPVRTCFYELSNPDDLRELERIMTRTEKFEVLVNETIILPYRAVIYEVVGSTQK